MSKRKKSKKAEIEEAKKASLADIPVERVHRPRIERFHVAHEFRDRLATDLAEEATRHLMPRLRGIAQGLSPTHYVHKGWRSSGRRARIKGVDA